MHLLLLRAAEVLHPGTAIGSGGFADPTLLLLWSLHNLVKALLSQRGGMLSDRYGRRRVIAAGWAAYAITYLAFAFCKRRLADLGALCVLRSLLFIGRGH